MKLEELKEIISNGENSYIEFKEEGIRAKDLAEEIVAFANSEGGMILIGIDDDGNITDIADPLIEGKTIANITISKGINIASREELLRLFEAIGALHFDISPVEDTSIKDLNLEVIRDYFLKYNTFDLHEESEETTRRILINADIMTEANNKILCTVGGLLIFGINPEKRLPQNGVSFAHFKGSEITDSLIDKKVITGRIQDIAEQVMVVIKNNMKSPSVINGIKREEKEEYPALVLREAIVNTLVHRNYSISGSRIRIFMFDDRIEFHSPGRLPNTVTIEKMKIGVSYARNPFLVKYMENMRYIDQLGRGIPMIMKSMKEIGAKEPIMQESGDEFVLTIHKA